MNQTDRQEAAFIHANQAKLIQRACDVNAILDQLLGLRVINDEEYSDIRTKSTPQEKMRALLRGPMRAAGVSGKAKLYKILWKEHPYMMKDLKAASGNMDQTDRQEAEFIDRNQDKLIQRAYNVDPILDQLLPIRAINDEDYSNIRAERTSQSEMRALLRGPMRADGVLGKAKLYESLWKERPYEIKDLKAASRNMDQTVRQEAEFIDQNQHKLIQTASNMDAILHQLLSLKVINHEDYSDIHAKSTPQEKMRALLTGPIRAAGVLGKAKLYEILMK
ncbi:uncharacterized protein LOC134300888 [Trichomycterus rosablanca]|uniref:uncharacterized protein LOC134300888 n=1 Tax=Trichomycterus rosablanca TaxID=2290929 RepID=UPI002F35B4F4